MAKIRYPRRHRRSNVGANLVFALVLCEEEKGKTQGCPYTRTPNTMPPARAPATQWRLWNVGANLVFALFFAKKGQTQGLPLHRRSGFHCRQDAVSAAEIL